MASYRLGNLTKLSSRLLKQSITQSQKSVIIRQISSQKTGSPSTFKLGLVGIGLGTAFGTGYTGYKYLQENKTKVHLVNEKEGKFYLDKRPDVKITRQIVNPNDDSNLDLVLFQFQTCPFCCKVRSFLDYSGFSYEVVEVDAVLRQSIKWAETKKVPLLLAKTKDGRYVQLDDSSMIISVLSSFMRDKSQDIGALAEFYPSISYMDDEGRKKSDIMNKYFVMFQEKVSNPTKDALEEERKWRSWADSHLVHLISPNVYRDTKEALETFEWFSETGEWDVHFPKWERDMMVYIGAFAMWAISKRLKRRHNLTDDVRSHLYDACDSWTNEIKKKKTKFMGGQKPNLSDLSVFGVLSSMEGCLAFKDCLENTNIGEWFYSVKTHIMQNRGNIM